MVNEGEGEQGPGTLVRLPCPDSRPNGERIVSSLIRYILSICCVPGIVLGPRHAAVTGIDRVPPLLGCVGCSAGDLETYI